MRAKKLGILFELTNKCNLTCNHCYYQVEKSPYSEIPINPLIQFLKKNKESLGRVTLTGGEPLLYSNLEELLNRLADYEIPFNLNTNATLLTEKRIQKLSDSGMRSISISIDSPISSSRDLVHQGHRSAVRGLHALLQKKDRTYKIRVVSVLAKQNYKKALSIYNSLKNLNIDDFCFQPVFIPRNNPSLFQKFSLYDLTNEELNLLFTNLNEWAEDTGYSTYIQFWKKYVYENIINQPCLNTSSFWCSSDGKLFTCFAKTNSSIGNLNSNIQELYNSPAYKEHIVEARKLACFSEKCFCAFPGSLKNSSSCYLSHRSP
jgi:MoaA/NifB/PqqE/SkfB family radical SAM enzyme